MKCRDMGVDDCYGCEHHCEECYAETAMTFLGLEEMTVRRSFVLALSDPTLGNVRHLVILRTIVERYYPQYLTTLENVCILR